MRNTCGWLSAAVLLFSCTMTQIPQTPVPENADPWLAALLWKGMDASGRRILAHPEAYHLQILYTRIDRDADNKPHFQYLDYGLDPQRYFYPASTVKLPIALSALEKIHDVDMPGLDSHSPMLTDSVYPGTPAVREDLTAPGGLPSVAHYVRKIFLVSDNDAANRLYEFVGQRSLNDNLHAKGYTGMDILHRLDLALPADQNRHTNPVRFLRGDRILYAQPEAYNPEPYPLRRDLVGRGYMRDGVLVEGPMDFSEKNRASLQDLSRMLQSVLFPASVPESARFRLDSADYALLYDCMSAYPGESAYPRYDPAEYPPAYLKFFLYGGDSAARIIPDVRIFSKSGWAYGFLTDVAYIVDFRHGAEFMLAATLYVNRDGILNDDQYEYTTTGMPFLAQLGRIVYQYELKRPRRYRPDLSRFLVRGR